MNPQNTPLRLALYNFLKFNLYHDSDLTPEMFEDFFNQCLEYPHWLNSKAQLGREVQLLIQNFNQKNKRTPIVSEEIRFPQDVQVIEIENIKDLKDVCAQYIETLLGTMDRYRIVFDFQKRPLGLIVRENQSCEIHQFDRKFTLRGGRLEPLRKKLTLYYNQDLTLDPEKIQNIELSPYLVAQFRISDSRKLYGFLKRGYVFQNLTDFRGNSFYECSKLFQSVKKMEALFFEKSRDEDYQNLLTSLENELHQPQLSFGHESPKSESEKKKLLELLQNAEAALETVFAGDKSLSALVEKFKSELSNNSSL